MGKTWSNHLSSQPEVTRNKWIDPTNNHLQETQSARLLDFAQEEKKEPMELFSQISKLSGSHGQSRAHWMLGGCETVGGKADLGVKAGSLEEEDE